MAAFALAFTATQSGDGMVVNITDTSNWSSNDENYTESEFVRQFTLTDYNGDLIIAITLTPGTNIATYTVPANTNPWINIELSAIGPVTLGITQKYGFQRNYEIAYKNFLKDDCGCCNGSRIDICQVDAAYQGAAFAQPIGDSINYQEDINAAYTLLTAQ